MKKIVFKFKSWYITELESDTILSYVFVYNFEKLKNIYEDFKNWKVPFNITNAFDKGSIIRPFYMSKDEKKDNSNNEFEEFLNNLIDEVDRKKIKKLWFIPLDTNILKLQLKDKTIEDQEEYNKKLWEISEKEESDKKNDKISEFKNSIPRFYKGDTNPFAIEDVNYTNQEKVIYVKVYDEEKYNRFFESLKNTFETIWWWKWKSRWYGKIAYVKNETLDTKEIDFFDYLQELKKENKYIVLNNYKPSENDLQNIDIEKSFINLNHKHTKSLDNMPFKWKMSFISAWSVLTWENLKWDFYKAQLEDKESINFWYLF